MATNYETIYTPFSNGICWFMGNGASANAFCESH